MKYLVTLCFITLVMAAHAQHDSRLPQQARPEYTYGFIHIADSMLNIPPDYSHTGNFSDGLAPVEKNGQWGFIDRHNREAIALQYNYARDFSKGQAIVQQGELYGVINPHGEFVIPPRYYDLKPYELESQRYYISRDSTFFAGIIDENGNEVLLHQYTYVMELEGFVTMGSPRLYKHIPFYTTYREIDTAKGSFYAQFSESPFEFGPEKGRQDYYDEQFNPVVSHEVASYDDVFSGEELTRIDTWLADHQDLDATAKRAGIQALLASPALTAENPALMDPAMEGLPVSEAEFDAYLAPMGYERYVDDEGKWGVRKDGEVLLAAQFDVLKWWGMPLFSPPDGGLDDLKEHFAGVYHKGNKELFLIFGIAAGNREGGVLYTMEGTAVTDLTHRRPERAMAHGLVYFTMVPNATGDTQRRFGVVSWKGEAVLLPNYTHIQPVDGNLMLAKTEKETTNGTEEYIGLYTAGGEVIIPAGVFSTIEQIPDAPDHFLAEWADPYPTKGEQKAREKENRHFVLLSVSDRNYSVRQQFTASMVYTRLFDRETGLLKYRKTVGKVKE